MRCRCLHLPVHYFYAPLIGAKGKRRKNDKRPKRNYGGNGIEAGWEDWIRDLNRGLRRQSCQHLKNKCKDKKQPAN